MKGLKSLDFSSFPLSNQMHYGSMFDTMNMKSISKRTGIVPGLILGYQHQKYNAHLLTLHFQNQQTLEHAHYIDYTDFFFFFFLQLHNNASEWLETLQNSIMPGCKGRDRE